MSVKAGWYRDRQDPTMAKYWDGEKWTGETKPVKEQQPGEQGKKKSGDGSSSRLLKPVLAVAAVAVIGVGGFFAYTSMSGTATEEPPAPTAVKTPKPTASASANASSSASASPGPTFAVSDPAEEMRQTITSLAMVLETSRETDGAYPMDATTVTGSDIFTPSDTVGLSVAYFDGQGNPVTAESDLTATPIASYLICGQSDEVNAAYFYDSAAAEQVGMLFPANACQQVLPVATYTWDPANVVIDIASVPSSEASTEPMMSESASPDMPASGSATASPSPSAMPKQ